MPRSLVSYWKRVAVSGPTADNREITVEELRDCAETYSLRRYVANIWNEHEREPGVYGNVFAVRLVEDDPDLEPGQVALEAQLKPNDKLLYLNDQGEKLFTSVEITPNFANSGRCYLSGLAITDSPASLGTQELYFNRKRKGRDKAAYFAAAQPLSSLRENSKERAFSGLLTSLASLVKRFSDTTTPSPDETKPMDEASAKALKALYDQLVIIVAGFQAVLEPVTETVDAADSQEQVDAVGSAVQDVVDTADEERQMSRNGGKGGKGGKGNDSGETKELSTRIDELTETMAKLLNTTQGRNIPRTTGAAGKQRGKGLR